MTKNILLIIGLFFIGFVQAQVGINTENPIGVFHIDSKADTNPAGSINISDDVVVTANGSMGIGTTTPAAKLEVRSTGTSIAPVAAVKIVDGTQVAEKVLTSKDNTGLAEWASLPYIPNRVEAVYTNKVAGVTDILYGGGTFNYNPTGRSITLPPGKWLVDICMAFEFKGDVPIGLNTGATMRSILSISTSSTSSPNTVFPDLAYIPSILSGPIAVNGTKKVLMKGSIKVVNTASVPQTYNYLLGAFTIVPGSSQSTLTGGNAKFINVGKPDPDGSTIVATRLLY